MHTRRKILWHSAKVASLLALTGLMPRLAMAAWNKDAFDAKSIGEVAKALGGAAPTASNALSITGPDIGENGAVVPIVASCSLPGVKRLAVLVEKNPSALAASYDVTEALEANISTRVKMAQTSQVYAVALMADGRTLFAQKEIKVTAGGCGG